MNNFESQEFPSLNRPESPPAPPRRLSRRAVSRQASAELMEGVQTQPPPSEDSMHRRPRRAGVISLLSTKKLTVYQQVLTRRVNVLEDLLDATNVDPAVSEVAPIDFSASISLYWSRICYPDLFGRRPYLFARRD